MCTFLLFSGLYPGNCIFLKRGKRCSWDVQVERDNEREIQDIYNRQSLTNFALELMQYVNMKRLMSVALVALSFLSGSSQCWTHQGNHRPPSGCSCLAWRTGRQAEKAQQHTAFQGTADRCRSRWDSPEGGDQLQGALQRVPYGQSPLLRTRLLN